MNYQDLFERFNTKGKLCFPGVTILFNDIPWSKHPTFDGVKLKHIVTAQETEGQFSYHLVRIAPGKTIGNHIR